MSKPLIIVGTSAFAEIAHEYFTHDSDYEVVSFAVHRKYIEEPTKFNLPITAIEDLQRKFLPQDHHFFVAVPYPQLNRLRTQMMGELREMGYKPASYISSQAYVWRNVSFGEHCFIFEDNTLQPFVKIGNNVIMWSGNHIGHHSTIEDNCFISSHVVISGFCIIGQNSFLGVNATISNDITVGADNWIGPNALITTNTIKGEYYRTQRTYPDDRKTAYSLNNVEPDIG